MDVPKIKNLFWNAPLIVNNESVFKMLGADLSDETWKNKTI